MMKRVRNLMKRSFWRGRTGEAGYKQGISVAAVTAGALLTFAQADEASVKIDVKEKEPVPVYYSAVVEHEALIAQELVSHVAEVAVKVIQGEAETFSFALLGGGEVTGVELLTEGENSLLSWATRQGEQGEFLDLTVKGAAQNFRFRVTAEQALEELPQEAWMWNLGAGEAVGFKAELEVSVAAGTVAEFEKLLGLTPERQEEEQSGWKNLLGAGPVSRNLVTSTGGEIYLVVRRAGVPAAKAELLGASLTGGVDEESEAVAFVLRGELVAHADGVELPLLGGGAAVSDLPKIDGLRFFVEDEVYYVEAEKAGRYHLSLPFVAKLIRESDLSRLYFTTPSTTVLPLDLAGLDGVKFSEDLAVQPLLKNGIWQGYVPASGLVSLGWREAGEEGDGALFFSSEGLVDIQVGAGLLRQDSYLGLKVLQGSWRKFC